MGRALSFGSAVVHSSADRVRDADGVGIVVELRTKDCRVQHLHTGKSSWIPLRELRPATEEEIAGSREEVIVRLLSMLGAIETEITLVEPDRLRVIAAHRAIKPETVDAVRAYLGARLLGYLMRPGSMSRIQTIVEFSAPR